MRGLCLALAFALGAAALAGSARAAEPYVLRGQVVDRDGPVAGAELRLLRPARGFPPAAGAPEDDALRATADTAGRFEIAVDLDDVFRNPSDRLHARVRWILEVSAPGRSPTLLTIPPVDHGVSSTMRVRPGVVEELGGILLQPGLRVTGRLVDRSAGGAAIAGARVALWPEGVSVPEPLTATSADDGRFAVEDVPPGIYVATFDRPGFVPLHLESVPVQPGGRPPAAGTDGPTVDLGTVELDLPVTVSGRVVDGAGKPLAGVAVRYRYAPSDSAAVAPNWLEDAHAETGAGGDFVLAGLPPEPERRFRLEKEGYRGFIQRLELEPAADGLRFAEPIVLTEALVIRGRVTRPSGEAIPGARVQPLTHGIVEVVSTGVDGRFEVGVRGKGPQVSIDAPGYAMKTVTLEGRSIFDETAGYEPIVLEPVETVDLLLEVRDADGRGVAGATARVARQGKGPVYYLRNVLTDDSGHARLDHAPIAEGYSVQVDHPDFPRFYRQDIEIRAGQEFLEVELAPPPWRLAEVRGRVVDKDGEPVRGAAVGLAPPDAGLPLYETRSDAAGVFELERVREGAYLLRAEAAGFALTEEPLRVIPGSEPRVVTLSRGTTLYGSVAGAPAGRRPALKVWASSGLSSWRHAVIDGDRYRIEHLAPGRWTVTAAAGELRTTAEIGIVDDEAETRLDLELPSGFRVEVLLLVDGMPRPDTHLALSPRPGSSLGYHSSRTDRRGRAVFEPVAAGSYHVQHVSELGTFRRPVPVDGDLERTVEVRTAPLAGRVVEETSGAGLAGLKVEALPEIIRSHGPTFEAVTDATGHFSIGPVLEGSWTLVLRAPGYVEARLPVVLPAEAPAVVELTPTAGLRVRVETAGRPPSFLGLRLQDADGRDVAREGLVLGGSREGHWADAPPGKYRLIADNRFVRVTAAVEIPGPVVILRFPPSGALTIRVPELELEADPPSRRPKTPVTVELVLEAPEDPSYDGPRTRESGRLFLEGLVPGLWRVEVRTGDGRFWSGSAQVVEGQRSELYLSSD